MNTYRLTFWRRCPSAPDQSILYTLEIRHDAMIMVERIKEAVEGLPNPAFHEAVADKLAAELPGQHRITARHHGVEIETVRP